MDDMDKPMVPLLMDRVLDGEKAVVPLSSVPTHRRVNLVIVALGACQFVVNGGDL